MSTRKRPANDEAGRAADDAEREAAIEAAVERAIEALSDKIERSITAKTARQQQKIAERTARQQERIASKAAHHIEQLDRLSTHLESLDLWTRDAPGGRKPRFTREQIAAAAVRIADAEGIDALSMRRIATELGAGTMTLYHYIRTKDELLALVMDAIMGEVVLPADEPMPDTWREAITVVATRSFESFVRHPWVLDIADDPPLGPNAVRHFDQTLQAVSSLPADLATKLDLATMVDQYVFGYALDQRNRMSTDEWHDAETLDYVVGLLDGGDYPALQALIADLGLQEAWKQIDRHQHDDSRFARNLGRILDGIEAELDQG